MVWRVKAFDNDNKADTTSERNFYFSTLENVIMQKAESSGQVSLLVH